MTIVESDTVIKCNNCVGRKISIGKDAFTTTSYLRIKDHINFLSFPSEFMSELGEVMIFRNSIRDRGKIKCHASVTAISSYSFETRGLKFGMKIHLINAVKLVGQIL